MGILRDIANFVNSEIPSTTQHGLTRDDSQDDRNALIALSAIGGAIALPVLAGGGIGVAMAGGAFGISAELLALTGGAAAAASANKMLPKVSTSEITPEDEYSDNEADLAYLRNGDF